MQTQPPPPRKTRVPVIACGVAIIRDGRRVLIAQRCEGDSFGSFWEFPGGKRDAGESFESCVVREAAEELGIEIAVESKLTEIRRRHKERVIWLNFYLCRHVSGEPRPLECQQVRWVDVAELGDYLFPPANEIVIRELQQRYG
ncbi:MAG: 8-oxo-dGTP diphosphatase [Candidatus Omnitrophica bacterium]|nr:8-oxo-dGTP diphosphatase [Candidatus Omnitrophota bacterium]